MIKALLVDDEDSNSNILSEIIKQNCPSVWVCAKATTIDEAEQLIIQYDIQLIFLDVEMPGGSGFDLLDRIKNKKIEVIFVTAYDSFLLKAIRYSALDYILKPVNILEIVNAVIRAEQRIAGESINKQLELLIDNIKQPAQVQRIAIPVKDEYIFIAIADIVRLEARTAYTEIFLNDGKSYLVSKNIKEYADLLPSSIFCRIHHAHLINMNFIKVYHKGRGGYVEMLFGAKIEVSVRRKEEFLNRFR